MLWSVIRLIVKTSSVTPDFLNVFNLILSFSTCSQSFKKICTWELLGANVLKRRVSFSMKGPKSPSDRFHNFLSLGWSQNSKHFYLFFDRLTNRIQSRSPQVTENCYEGSSFFKWCLNYFRHDPNLSNSYSC